MKNITWSWDEPNEDIKPDEIDYPEDIRQAELEMQALDKALEQKAWNTCQSEDIDPRNQEEEEEFGTPNAAYCQSMEQDHNGGWFCYHPDCVTSPDED